MNEGFFELRLSDRCKVNAPVKTVMTMQSCSNSLRLDTIEVSLKPKLRPLNHPRRQVLSKTMQPSFRRIMRTWLDPSLCHFQSKRSAASQKGCILCVSKAEFKFQFLLPDPEHPFPLTKLL